MAKWRWCNTFCADEHISRFRQYLI